MSDNVSGARVVVDEDPSLVVENGRLREEIHRLSRQAQDVARANAHAAELMAKFEEANERLELEVQKRTAAEAELRRVNAEIDATVHRQTAELIVANEQLTRQVAERKQAEQQQTDLLEQLMRINQELKEFAYIVSHDLKAPLRGIKALADWITADYADKLGQEGKDQMSLLTGRVDRMQGLIDGILQYSRLGRETEERVAINLSELLPGIVDMLAPPQHIHVSLQSGLPTLLAEETRMTQVFQNLISNAIKYMDKPQGQIHIAYTEADGAYTFRVSDNGPGIEEKYFERIFKLFQTLAPRDTCESTGVGLAVVKKIVEMYGGRIWVESKVGEGSTFLFTFPAKATCSCG